jgi:hypothetical protein
MDWDTLSLNMNASASGTTISQKNLKETGLETAIELREIAIMQFACKTEHGLVNSTFRSQIWPILAGVRAEENNEPVDWRSLAIHRDEDQVALDVQRTQCFSRIKGVVSDAEKAKYRKSLQEIIVRFLRSNPKLSYYQGFHDICALFLTVFSEDTDAAYKTMSIFALCHLRDFMMPDLTMSTHIIRLVPEILYLTDCDLYGNLLLDNIEPFFCLSPLITLFTHDIQSERSLSLIFDQIFSCGSISIVLYIYVALMMSKQNDYLEKIKAMEAEDIFSKQDLVHNALSKFLSTVDYNDIECAINDAHKYLKQFPLDKLPSYKAIGKFSVLRTSSTLSKSSLDHRTLEHRVNQNFEELLDKQLDHNSKLKNMKQASFLAKALSNRKSRQLIKISLTVGILSLVINLLLHKHSENNFIGPFYHKTWLEFSSHNLRPVLKELFGYP